MNCRDLRVLLRRSEVPSGPAVDAHLADCDACAELVRDEAALAFALGDEDDPTDEEMSVMLTAVRQELGAETGLRAWLRSRATAVRLAISVAVLAAVAGFVAVASPRADLAEMPMLRFVAAMTVYTGLAFASMRVALRPLSKPAAPEKASRLLIVAGLATAVGFALAPMASGIPITNLGMAFAPMVTACFMFGSVFAVPLLLLGWALDRGGYFIGSRLLLAGAAAGLAGNLFLELHCDIQLPAHLLMGHATVVVALLAVGLLLSWVTSRR